MACLASCRQVKDPKKIWEVPKGPHLSLHPLSTCTHIHMHLHTCIIYPSNDRHAHTQVGSASDCPCVNCGSPSILWHHRHSHKDIPRQHWPYKQTVLPGFPCNVIIKDWVVGVLWANVSSTLSTPMLCSAGALTFQDTETSRLRMPWSSPRKCTYLNLPLSSVPVGKKNTFFLNQSYINKLNSTSLS